MTAQFIQGEPPTWLGSGEKEWKARLAEFVRLTPSAHLDLEFRVSSLLRRGHRFDLDNMVTPVLDQILGPRRSELRRALLGWSASRRVMVEPGLRIVESNRVPDGPMGEHARVVLDVALCGGLPVNSRRGGVTFTEGIRHALGSWSPSLQHRFALELSFGDDIADISWVAEKPIKPIVDCLFPLLGGEPGAPEDWKIDEMRVRRGQPANHRACAVKAWLLPAAEDATDPRCALPQTLNLRATSSARIPSARTPGMTNYDRLDAAAKAMGSPPAAFAIKDLLARATSLHPEMVGVTESSASATMDFQTINVRGRAFKPGDFGASARWNESPAFLKVGRGLWRRLSEVERGAFARLWAEGVPMLRKPEFDAPEWDGLVTKP